MAIAIQPYTEEWIPAVKAFNQRLAAGGVAPEFHFPVSHIPSWLPKRDGRRIYQEFYLAVESDQVRGAYILKFQDFSLGGEIRPVVYYHLPISEGIVNKRYSSVGVHMLRTAMKAQPLLFCLGMGGFDRPLPQMLKAMKWELCAVPFFFWVNHPAKFLRQIAALRRTASRRMLSDAAAFTGSGWVGLKVLHRMRSASPDRRVKAEVISSFGDWADELWQAARARYTMVASRGSADLSVLYPSGRNFLCLKVSRAGQPIGWAVVLDTQMQNNKYFGDMRLGSIADCFASPDDACAVMRAAREFLQERGVDLVVSNQSHAAWTGALKSAGFLSGPSNFIFAASRPLSEAIGPLDQIHDQLHLTRGDGDGPVNL
jgi:hypothetical protein